ncbi:hemolysin family protein [Nocardioides sp. WL0053]|jgi:magnesium and cobalt exporter, CNNM family|uniref:Hemolysin family protein n=1 Tax=Nocardioides jiangsuensis TaxID=2866161 RepID=A0ABS7RMU3_9ACTN|nr:hemolysin family protein [Nocardioides jiangsuensis]MBY9076355.1 hemolysin family protein [Nocardioides jiangsuensis]
MNGTLANIGLVVVFVLIGGVFAAAEISLVSLRDGQARALSTRGKRGRIVAELNEDPNRFLAAVQVGVTLAGFLSAAFGGATLSGDLTPVLVDWGIPPGVASPLALVLVTIAISYMSLVFGELVPKRLGLQRAEAFSLALGPMIDKVSKVSRPVIWVLSKSTNFVVRLLGGDPDAQKEQMSDEELRELVNAHETLGEEERRIVEDVFEAGDRQIREVMIPRTEVDFLDASTPVYRAAKDALAQPHSRYPVIRGSADDVIGFVHVRDLLDPEMANRSVRVGELSRQTLVLPWTRPLLAALADMRREGTHLAIVADEYGGTAGIVTMEDLVEELIGDIKDEYDVDEAETTRLRGGDVEVDGLLNLDDFEDETGVELPEGPYETLAGFIMARLGRVPEAGDTVDFEDHRLVVREVEGRRVARVLVTVVPPPVVLSPEAADAAREAEPEIHTDQAS